MQASGLRRCVDLRVSMRASRLRGKGTMCRIRASGFRCFGLKILGFGNCFAILLVGFRALAQVADPPKA